MKITSKLLKNLIGETIWYVPRMMSNSFNRGKSSEEQITFGKIIKVGSKKVTLMSGKLELSMNIDGSYDAYNECYTIFLSEQDAIDYFKVKYLSRELKNVSWDHLSLEEIKIIENIIKNNSNITYSIDI